MFMFQGKNVNGTLESDYLSEHVNIPDKLLCDPELILSFSKLNSDFFFSSLDGLDEQVKIRCHRNSQGRAHPKRQRVYSGFVIFSLGF